MHILHVVGARPNFVKAAPVIRALGSRTGIRQTLVHTGQHYDPGMSDCFFRELELPTPNINLEVGSASHARQTAQVMSRFEPVVLGHKPDLVLVYGDVNSTVAAALVCAKLLVPVGHVEAGLRSFDRTMPEEVNRILTDRVADLLFTPSEDADENLLREGVARERIYFVGNVMIDTLVHLLPKIQKQESQHLALLDEQPYGLVTLHRPSNVDDPAILTSILMALNDISNRLPLLFPVHPRTHSNLASLDVALNSRLHLLEPLGYLETVALERRTTLVITDSGGMQEETTFLGVPCLTVRKNTERPITVSQGTNTLVGQDPEQLQAEAAQILDGNGKKGQVPPLWDGRGAERIVEAILAWKQTA